MLAASALAETYTETYIYLDLDQSGDIELSVIDDTLYYKNSFFRGLSPETGGFSIAFLDIDNNMLLEGKAYPSENNLFPFDTRIALLKVSSMGQFLYERQISFCNLDGICEPCNGKDCSLIENSLTCADCPSGGNDYFCDLVNDGICDPDCNNKDADCPTCTECWYRDTTIPSISCAADKGGVACMPGQLCTGDYVYADDTGSLCCIDGECMDKTVTVPIEGYDDTPKIPDESVPPGNKPQDKPGQDASKNQWLWLIPVIAAAVILVLAYFMLIKPKARK